jgi:integrase
LHKPSGLAVVTLGGKDRYLGRYGSPESRATYDRLIAEWLAGNRQREPGRQPSPLTISEMILAVWHMAEKHYRTPDGEPTGELDNLRDALRPLRRLYGNTAATAFGPLALRSVREDMIRGGLCRKTINARINRIRRAFRWAASIELIPGSIPQALASVPGLQPGRSAARESKGVSPIAWEIVESTLPHLPRQVAAMVQVMRFSNCRAADVVLLRGCDLQMNGDLWVFRPRHHKNAWRGHERVIYLGSQAQEVIRPFLKADLQAFLFSPRDAVEEHHARRRAARSTRRTPSELRRRRRPSPRWIPHDRYQVNAFQQAIRRACRRAGLSTWSILQVRHARASEIRDRYGVEGAAASLGHRRVETSQIYAEHNDRLSRDIAREVG